jgi:hypothetical protein
MTPQLSVNLERKDITIPLHNVSVRLDELITIANPLIALEVERARPVGWENDGSIDALALMHEGRLGWREHNAWWSDTSTYSLQSATVRLRRTSTSPPSIDR